MKTDWLIRIIDNTTTFDYDLSVQPCETDNWFMEYRYRHCDIVNFSIQTAQIEFWCEKDHPSDYPYRRADIRGCYCIDNPDVGVLKQIWDKTENSRECIKMYLKNNKPIPGSEKEMNWAMSIILGGNDG